MSIEPASQTRSQEEAPQQAASSTGSVALKPSHLLLAGPALLGALALTVLLTSRTLEERSRLAASDLAKAHAAVQKELQGSLADKEKEIERLNSRLKESYEKQSRLIVRATDLEAKVKAFQGSLNISQSSLLPSRDAVMPVSVSPVFTSGETPFIKDGSRWLAVRKEGLFVATAAPRDVRDAFSGRSIKVPEAARSLAAKPAPAAGSVLILGPDRELIDLVRPVFRWKKQAGMIGSIQCAILDKEGRTLALSDPLTSDSWQAPNPLPRGHAYTWRIVSPNPAEPERAHVLAESFFVLLSEAESGLVNRKVAEAGGSLLLRMNAFLEAGLTASAELEARKFCDVNPGLKDGQRLLSQVKALRPERAEES